MTKSRQSQRALITGASSGIGHELAWCFAKGGYDLVLTARSQKKLQELAAEIEEKTGREALVLPADLEQPQAAEQLYRQLQRRKIEIDLLVNNAGFGTYGLFVQKKLSEEIAIANLNMLTPVKLTRLFLPAMLAKGSGGILNVASIAAFLPGPFMSSYNASKAFLLSHSAALQAELIDSGVTMTVLCPGVTKTSFSDRAGVSKRGSWGREVRTSTATSVAKAGFQGFLAGQAMVIPGWQNYLIILLPRLLPRFLLLKMMYMANRPAKKEKIERKLRNN